MSNLLVIGAGGHGRVVSEIAQACGYAVAFLDDMPGDGIVGRVDELEKYVNQYDAFFVGIGNNSTRCLLTRRLEENGLTIATLIHPTAYVSPSAAVDVGSVVEPGALVNANSKIGMGCIISVGAVVDHDVEVESYAHINAGAVCEAGSHIESHRKLKVGEIVRADF